MADIRMTAEELREVLFATEHGRNPATIHRFSYAGANSSYSFGLLQFDVGARKDARQFLAANGFTRQDIRDLSQLGGLDRVRLADLDAKLRAVPDARLNEYTDNQLQNNIGRIGSLVDHLKRTNPGVADAILHGRELQLALADYDNQFGIEGIGARSPPNTMLAYLEGHPVRRNGQTLQLADGLTRRDIQDYIDGTSYAQAHPRSVRGREERLLGALSKLDLLAEKTSLAGAQPAVSTLHLGATGPEVAALQERLARLGYTDAKGRPVAADGQFGPVTQAAVEAFQRDHGLADDGRVGQLTRGALDGALEERRVAGADADPRSGTLGAASRRVAPTSGSIVPDHPRRALYDTLHSVFPPGTSEARLYQAVAACHDAGIVRPQQLASVVGTDDTIYFGSHEPGSAMGQMDISRAAPAVDASLQHVYSPDAQQVILQSRAQPAPAVDLQ